MFSPRKQLVPEQIQRLLDVLKNCHFDKNQFDVFTNNKEIYTTYQNKLEANKDDIAQVFAIIDRYLRLNFFPNQKCFEILVDQLTRNKYFYQAYSAFMTAVTSSLGSVDLYKCYFFGLLKNGRYPNLCSAFNDLIAHSETETDSVDMLPVEIFIYILEMTNDSERCTAHKVNVEEIRNKCFDMMQHWPQERFLSMIEAAAKLRQHRALIDVFAFTFMHNKLNASIDYVMLSILRNKGFVDALRAAEPSLNPFLFLLARIAYEDALKRKNERQEPEILRDHFQAYLDFLVDAHTEAHVAGNTKDADKFLKLAIKVYETATKTPFKPASPGETDPKKFVRFVNPREKISREKIYRVDLHGYTPGTLEVFLREFIKHNRYKHTCIQVEFMYGKGSHSRNKNDDGLHPLNATFIRVLEDIMHDATDGIIDLKTNVASRSLVLGMDPDQQKQLLKELKQREASEETKKILLNLVESNDNIANWEMMNALIAVATATKDYKLALCYIFSILKYEGDKRRDECEQLKPSVKGHLLTIVSDKEKREILEDFLTTNITESDLIDIYVKILIERNMYADATTVLLQRLVADPNQNTKQLANVKSQLSTFVKKHQQASLVQNVIETHYLNELVNNWYLIELYCQATVHTDYYMFALIYLCKIISDNSPQGPSDDQRNTAKNILRSLANRRTEEVANFMEQNYADDRANPSYSFIFDHIKKLREPAQWVLASSSSSMVLQSLSALSDADNASTQSVPAPIKKASRRKRKRAVSAPEPLQASNSSIDVPQAIDASHLFKIGTLIRKTSQQTDKCDVKYIALAFFAGIATTGAALTYFNQNTCHNP